MNLQELKQIIDEYKDKIIINSLQPGQLKSNKLLLQKYKYIFCTIKEMIYLVKNYDNLENLHVFCNCRKKNNFLSFNRGYRLYCSRKCAANDEQNKEKIIQTKLNNIDENGLNSFQRHALKIAQAKLSNIDENGLNRYQKGRKKQIQTMKSIVDENGLNSFQKMYLKQKQTKLNNIDENGLNSYQRGAIKTKQKMLNNIDKNGLNSYQRSTRKGVVTLKKDIDENGLNGYDRLAIKVKQKMLIIDKSGLNKYQKACIKGIQTKKKNNSFNKSKQEDQVYNYLLQKFNKNNIERQYRSEEYPFNCDFYIKSLDLYIECHFGWTHFPNKKGKPFKHSVEDIIDLQKLNNKNTKFYDNVIDTWTKRDPLKLSYFKKNKLKHKIFYKIEHFLNWFNKI